MQMLGLLSGLICETFANNLISMYVQIRKNRQPHSKKKLSLKPHIDSGRLTQDFWDIK